MSDLRYKVSTKIYAESPVDESNECTAVITGCSTGECKPFVLILPVLL